MYSPESSLKKAPKNERSKTDFAEPKNQPVEGLSAEMGEVPVLSTNQELQQIISQAKSNRDKRQIESQLAKITTLKSFREFLNKEGIPSSEHQNLENEFLQELSLREQKQRLEEKRAKRKKTFGQKLQEAMPTFSSWAKKGVKLVDKHLDGNGVGNKLADLIQSAKDKYQVERQKSAEISTDFKQTLQLEKDRKFPINPNLFFAGIGAAGLAMGTAFLLETSTPKIAQPETLNSPTLTDKIKEAEKDKQFLPPSLELENSSLDIQKEIMQSDLYLANGYLDLAQSYLDRYSVITQSDKDTFGREMIAYRAKLENLKKEFRDPNADIAKLSEQLLETYKQIYHLQQTFENNESRTELEIGTFEKYAKEIPKVSQEEINLRKKFNNNLDELRSVLQTLKDRNAIMSEEGQLRLYQKIGEIIGLSRHNDANGVRQANKDLLELIKSLQETKYQFRPFEPKPVPQITIPMSKDSHNFDGTVQPPIVQIPLQAPNTTREDR